MKSIFQGLLAESLVAQSIALKLKGHLAAIVSVSKIRVSLKDSTVDSLHFLKKLILERKKSS